MPELDNRMLHLDTVRLTLVPSKPPRHQRAGSRPLRAPLRRTELSDGGRIKFQADGSSSSRFDLCDDAVRAKSILTKVSLFILTDLPEGGHGFVITVCEQNRYNTTAACVWHCIDSECGCGIRRPFLDVCARLSSSRTGARNSERAAPNFALCIS